MCDESKTRGCSGLVFIEAQRDAHNLGSVSFERDGAFVAGKDDGGLLRGCRGDVHVL